MIKRRKEIKELLDIIKPYGYTIIQTRKHRKILNQNGQSIYSFPSTPSDRNFIKQIIRDLKRLGLIDV
jgi:hypothetical protein